MNSADPLRAATIGQAATPLGLALTTQQTDLLEAYARLLLKWNRVHNLTAIAGPDDVLTHHLLDCLAAVPTVAGLTVSADTILDVGSGGGLPGIVLAIALPDRRITLIDRVQKKTAFLRQAVLELGLANTTVAHARIEDWQVAPKYTLIIARAFAALPDFVALTRHLIADTGRWLAMKGAAQADELAGVGPESIERIIALDVPTLDASRSLIIVRPQRRAAPTDENVDAANDRDGKRGSRS